MHFANFLVLIELTGFTHEFVPYIILIWRGCELVLSRQEQSHSNSIVGVRFFYFCIKGVAGFVVPNKTKINDTVLWKVWYNNFIGENNG